MSDKTKAITDVGLKVTKITAEKNLAYGDSAVVTEGILRNLFPDGIPVEKYRNALLIVRVQDKMVRLAQGEPGAFEEDEWEDVAGYGILGAAIGRFEQQEEAAPFLPDSIRPKPAVRGWPEIKQRDVDKLDAESDGSDPATEYQRPIE